MLPLMLLLLPPLLLLLLLFLLLLLPLDNPLQMMSNDALGVYELYVY